MEASCERELSITMEQCYTSDRKENYDHFKVYKEAILHSGQGILQRIAGCGETVTREEFDRLWQWLFPVALALSTPQIGNAWESLEPKWIEGMISREEAEAFLRASEGFSRPGTFIIRFASSRSWPHPDAGALIASYVGLDYDVHHRLLLLDESGSDRMEMKQPLEELLSAQPELSQLCRVCSTQQDTASS